MEARNVTDTVKYRLFKEYNLKELQQNADFKEDSVREVIILPILKELGYQEGDIVRSKALQHPFLKTGSKKRPITLIPDYALKVLDNYAWVLDAKSPKEKITNEEHIEQIYSYATHPEIRSTYFALCNGIEFALFRRESTNQPILQFPIDEIDFHWESLVRFLSPSSFQTGKIFSYESAIASSKREKTFDYINRPLLEEIPVRKRATKRHFGVHGYFTKQSWDIVQNYIKNFTKPGDLVLDPFSGSGITPVEALITNRKSVCVDINPLAVFLVKSLVVPVDINALTQAYEEVIKRYKEREPKTEKEIERILKELPYPKGLTLPIQSDVHAIEQLFSRKQLSQLALLKHYIIRHKFDQNVRDSLLLMFSGLLTKHNLTYHTSTYVTKEGGGDAAAFRYYRYRIAPNPVSIDLCKYFDLRFKKVLAAKKEIAPYINNETIQNVDIRKGSATDLHFIPSETVDYIYTDPPYGSKIPYLDLSIMWNAWLDLEVTESDFEQEAIVGGEHNKSKQSYNELIAQSIKEMYRVMKYDRWMSFVFAHKDPEFWHLIIETAESCGFEYKGAVPQKNGQTSFKKRQRPFTVLSGQLIINFQKVRKPKAILKAHLGMELADIVMETIESVIAKNDGATLEQINDELIIRGLELGFLDLLKKYYTDLTPLLTDNFDYDEEKKVFRIRLDKKFRTNVDVRLRIRYFLLSYMRRKERESKFPTFEDVIFNIMPLLKNGITPEEQTILGVLEDVGVRVRENCWRLKEQGQKGLFDF